MEPPSEPLLFLLSIVMVEGILEEGNDTMLLFLLMMMEIFSGGAVAV